jgi:hypothetical protein
MYSMVDILCILKNFVNKKVAAGMGHPLYLKKKVGDWRGQ